MPDNDVVPFREYMKDLLAERDRRVDEMFRASEASVAEVKHDVQLVDLKVEKVDVKVEKVDGKVDRLDREVAGLKVRALAAGAVGSMLGGLVVGIVLFLIGHIG